MPDSISLKIETNIAVAMRDGVTLYADIYRPEGNGPFPTILQRTPYDKTNALSASMLDPIRSAKAGFAVVIQDTRGRHASEGEFYAFVDDIGDGYDTVEWAAAQPWSNGKVGMYGASYVGATQWLAATSRPPHLVALAPTVTASNYHDGWTYQGGAFELGFNMSWTLLQLTLANFENVSSVQNVPRERRGELIRVVDNMTEGFEHLPTKDFPGLDSGMAKYYYDWLAHPDFDDYWKKLCIEGHHSEIDVPAMHLGGWYDIFLGGTIRNYLGMKESGANETARGGQKLIIGPWAHGARGSTMAGRHYFGIMADPAATDIDGMHLRWFDHWLNDGKNGITEEAPVRIFVMGDDQWRDEQEWPLARAIETKYYLHSGGKANSKNGDGSLEIDSPQSEPPDVFLYNPADPVPTAGGALCCNPYYAANGAYDQNEVEERQDVLVYSTPPLERDMEVTGPVTVTLWASTSATDTDFTAKLVDVCENGCARNLTDGIIRARYRDSMSNPTMLEPGRPYCYDIDLWATSNVFKAGHQIRLEISSSNFPRFDRNTNTGNIIAEDTELRPALQTIFHDGQQASYVSVAIVPR
ncbi:MAG: CocE/NonD family hydrolase [SAR202 cluster bacterium]|jgi:putative CocE/NonD family hydrolase|nr:CocE/NonD family hydrolase [SAR202 cluster bacterium]|tara:strand:+ start:5854 stop:7599 length:1746 start_codon:yes stop_codon:yes gene_type:complete